MSKLRTFLVSALALTFAAGGLRAQTAAPAPSANKPLDHDVYDIWNRLGGQALSDDGAWALYVLTNEARGPELHVKQLAGSGTEHVVERGDAAQFTEDARFVVFRIKPTKEAVDQAKREKKKPDQMPQDSMGILDLGTGRIVRVAMVKSFKLPEHASGWLAYQLGKGPAKPDSAKSDTAQAPGAMPEPNPNPTGEKAESAAKKEKKKEEGTALVVRNLATGQERRIEHAGDYAFSGDGETLVYTVSTKDGAGDGAYVLTTATGETKTLLSGKGDYKQLVADENSHQAAFLSDATDYAADQPEYTLYHWDGSAAVAEAVASSQTAALPDGWWVSENGELSFSHDGGRLFFGTAMRPEPEPEPDTMAIESEQVHLDVWSWTDPLLQPMQLKQLDEERKRTYEAVVNLEEGKVVQLATTDVPDIILADRGDGGLALGRSGLPYRQAISWGESGADYYIVNLETGQRDEVIEYLQGGGGFGGGASLSPEGHYAYWFDGDAKAWFTMDMTDRTIRNVTKDVPFPVYEELHDTPSLPGPYGMAGWTTGDERFLVYDRNDIWAVDPAGKEAPKNITEGAGRRDTLRFRYAEVNPEERAIDPSKDLLLSAFQLWTKQDGFYRDRVDGNAPPAKVLMADRAFGRVRKADDADVLMLTSESFRDYPDLYIASPAITDMHRISDANPQQAQYIWGTSELVQWRSLNGELLQGVLYKPDNFDASKKWPMMVYFYERLSDRKNNYITPAAGSSSINISFYVSRGYLVFTPDIPYRIGYPGESAENAVVPGVLAMIAKGFVDPDNIGVQGHSWGGYQIGYLVTKTNIFKAAEAGAPVADMISAYGGIRWGSGMVREFQYEHTQSRIGGTLWEAPLHFIENSPIFWVDKVETPLLMMHNDEDGAVPWYQGIEYFVALRRLHKPAWLIVYNGEDHGLRKEWNRKDWTIRLQQYFDHYLKGAPAPVWLAEGIPAIEKGKTLGLELIQPAPATTSSSSSR